MRHPFLTRSLIILVAVGFVACNHSEGPVSNDAATTAGALLQTKSAALPGIHPVEQRLYEYTSAYVMRMDAALAEPDDRKAIAQLQKVKSEMAAQTNALQLELDSWLNTLSEAERKAFRLRMMQQESISKNYQFLSDPKLGLRIGTNPQLRAAFEDAHDGAIQIWLPKQWQ